MYLAIGFVFASPVVVLALQRWSIFGEQTGTVARAEGVVLPAAGLSLGSAAIHAAVLGDHFEESALIGLFFVLAAALGALWALLFVLRPTVRLAALGLGFNLGIVAVWVASRTTGLPFGGHPWVPEAISAADGVATAFELLLAGLLLGLLLPTLRRRLMTRRMTVPSANLVVLVSFVATTMATVVGLVDAAAGHGH